MARKQENPGGGGVERSAAGQPIYRHQRAEPFEVVGGDGTLIRAVSEHIERHLGPSLGVFHELISDKVHLDVHFVGPSEPRPFHTLVTSGMSERPMTLPAGVTAPDRAELVLSLPPTWKLDQRDFADERNYWPVRWLKTLARLPHQYRTWLGFGHTVPTSDPPRSYADDTELCCMIVLPPAQLPDEFHTPTLPDGTEVAFYTLVALYREEMQYKLDHGTAALLERFTERGIGAVIDPRRENVCL